LITLLIERSFKKGTAVSRQPDEDKQHRILKAAIEVFGTLGLEGATMKDIADRAGVAPGTLYTYFTDKEALFVGAVDQVWDGFFEGVGTIFGEGRDPRELSARLIQYGMETLTQLHPLVRGMISAANRLDLMHQRLDALALEISKNLGGLRGTEFESMRIWIAGVLFIFASVPAQELGTEIARLKTSLMAYLESA